MNDWDCCDDYGVWVVVLKKLGGRWESEEDAQEECNRRNFAAGISNEEGELKAEITQDDEAKFQQVHYLHAECTCFKGSKGTVDRQVNGLN